MTTTEPHGLLGDRTPAEPVRDADIPHDATETSIAYELGLTGDGWIITSIAPASARKPDVPGERTVFADAGSDVPRDALLAAIRSAYAPGPGASVQLVITPAARCRDD